MTSQSYTVSCAAESEFISGDGWSLALVEREAASLEYVVLAVHRSMFRSMRWVGFIYINSDSLFAIRKK